VAPFLECLFRRFADIGSFDDRISHHPHPTHVSWSALTLASLPMVGKEGREPLRFFRRSFSAQHARHLETLSGLSLRMSTTTVTSSAMT